jgi:ribonuclease Y
VTLTVLAIAVLILGVVVAGGFVLLLRTIRQNPLLPQQPAMTRSADEEAGVAARTDVVTARTDAAAARAEARAARTESRRILDAAREEANGVLERAHRQADHDADQVRADARRAAERETESLTTVVREQSTDAERRQQRLDELERLLAQEA